jgi:hypothetical protein
MSTKILDTAKELVAGERTKHYGPPFEDFKCVAKLWSAWLSRKAKKEVVIEALDIPILMVLLKTSRQANAWKDDNLVDIAGYAECAAMAKEHASGGVYGPRPRTASEELRVTVGDINKAQVEKSSEEFNKALFEHVFGIGPSKTGPLEGRVAATEVAEIAANGKYQRPELYKEETQESRIEALEALTKKLSESVALLEEREAVRQIAEKESKESLKGLIDSLADTL